ncbi:sensor histidine kinase [Acholeplasma hippikon]|uniref:histidine kinase n=1 Tax=Acholeplasma hippikon TaxID=264636 RepID=A0A449BKM6_9MOLU|nr:HAMP domain-containing sensor histidine kinase [Acholeplasma hippikon]VEU83026.1 Sensor histidine kinase CssS [Acholeplasma hippikon]
MAYLNDYYAQVRVDYDPYTNELEYDHKSIYNDYLIIRNGSIALYSNENVSEEYINYVAEHVISEYFENNTTRSNQTITYVRYKDIAYMGIVSHPMGTPKFAVVVVSNATEYIQDMTGSVPFYATLAFLSILVLGNVIIWLWSSTTVSKLKVLQEKIDDMIKTDYQSDVRIDAAEEITSLANAIDNMRNQIKENERTKKEMVQNMGHDLKTPIAVIKSYAEAILDGIEDTDAAQLIIKQADILNKKVLQIMEYNKLGYIKSDQKLEDVSMREVLTSIVNNYKYITHAEITLNIDSDWVHPMIKENLYVAISNIMDNAVRYVQSKIIIQLQNKKLTIYNDGEQIDPEFLPRMFKAYEKGSKGQFGLGLAIVKQTLGMFGLSIRCDNKPNGVEFTIEQL